MTVKKGPRPDEVQQVIDLATTYGGAVGDTCDWVLGRVDQTIRFDGKDRNDRVAIFLSALQKLPFYSSLLETPRFQDQKVVYGSHITDPEDTEYDTTWVFIRLPDPRPRKYPKRTGKEPGPPKDEKAAMRRSADPTDWKVLGDLLTDEGANPLDVAEARATGEVHRLFAQGLNAPVRAKGYDVATFAYEGGVSAVVRRTKVKVEVHFHHPSQQPTPEVSPRTLPVLDVGVITTSSAPTLARKPKEAVKALRKGPPSSLRWDRADGYEAREPLRGSWKELQKVLALEILHALAAGPVV